MNTRAAEIPAEDQEAAKAVIAVYGTALGGIEPDYFVKNRADGPYLIIEFQNPQERHHRILAQVLTNIPPDNPFKDRTAILKRKKAPEQRLSLPEARMLKMEIAECLTIDRHSFDGDFFSRYTPSVFDLEQQIITRANYIVYGRRGAGKSSLLSYAMQIAKRDKLPFCWIAMQTFANRSDLEVVPAVLAAILHEISSIEHIQSEATLIYETLSALSEGSSRSVLTRCDKLIPRVRNLFTKIATKTVPLTIFLDDIHVLRSDLQPLVLSYIYKTTRGNNAFIKASGIDQLTRLWDESNSIGLKPVHDTQVLNLDLNLTMPEKSKEHITKILDLHAKYCGLSNINYIAGDPVLSRLVLAAAGVPRDALNLFSIAFSKALLGGQKLVSVNSINTATSEMAEQKIKDIELDSGEDIKTVKYMLDEIKDFCLNKEHQNAFLVEIKNSDDRYRLIQKLAALRLVHLLHEGITPREAGRRFIALMLDFGFYVGIRAAKSVSLILAEPKELLAKDLRSLPIFK
ncbi:AAA family ATPase [Rhodoblastus acidophilus]|uniref:AAA family ATPase n=1 Tax=Rhodoblastus acidophilus TaxID=1074 RepID=A0A6N8DS16_RHOAC|nr:ATP-binding protein [Rhodoblastus acidophilus]MCW2275471.1 Cdc6-like AAA superfamily ATPase [Rhodoblastus acidophilus]MTV31973.1 AAA family ATPase [Rhodoblastus acidophilus]